MSENKAQLFLRRLIVLSGEDIAYDEVFHNGLNIIRGENSSGKSTILDFIFYVLGGDVLVWKTAASLCTSVLAEVEINGIILTLQRIVDDKQRRPMAIFFGPVEEAKKHRYLNWREYPYASQGESESFSRFLFRSLKFPDVRADLDSNLTMNQVLRLAYVDQISRTTSLMREEDFDSRLKRKTIAELLFGVYDDTLYADQINLRIIENELNDIVLQITNTNDVFEEVGEEIDLGKIQAATKKAKDKLKSVNDDIDAIVGETVRVVDTSQTEIEKLRTKLAELRKVQARLAEQVRAFDFEILDAEVFLENLASRLKSIDDSIATRDVLGELPHCPLCAVPLKQLEGKVTCELSGHEVKGDFGRSNMLKMREELYFQQTESNRIQARRLTKRAAIAAELAATSEAVELTSKTYQQKIRATKSARDNRMDELYLQKGQLETALENLAKLEKYAHVMLKLTDRKKELSGKIGALKEAISQKEKKQAGRWHQANATIENHVRHIVGRDLTRQEEFTAVDSIELDFGRNTYWLNGKNNFSASSNAVLKNAIHFGLLFASTEDPAFRYPRILLCDNVEDGGMEEPRSKNFQRVVASMSESATPPFQVILSTSMIDPSLDNTPYCVGPKYTKSSKSLKVKVTSAEGSNNPASATVGVTPVAAQATEHATQAPTPGSPSSISELPAGEAKPSSEDSGRSPSSLGPTTEPQKPAEPPL